MAGFLEIRAANGSYIWYRDRITHARRQCSFSIDSGRRRKGREASSVQCLKHDTLLLPVSDLSLLFQARLLGLLGSVQILRYYSTGSSQFVPTALMWSLSLTHTHTHTHTRTNHHLLHFSATFLCYAKPNSYIPYNPALLYSFNIFKSQFTLKRESL